MCGVQYHINRSSSGAIFFYTRGRILLMQTSIMILTEIIAIRSKNTLYGNIYILQNMMLENSLRKRITSIYFK